MRPVNPKLMKKSVFFFFFKWRQKKNHFVFLFIAFQQSVMTEESSFKLTTGRCVLHWCLYKTNAFSTLCCWCDNRGQKLLHIIDRLSRFMHLKSNLIMWKNKINNRNRKFLAGWWTLTVSDDTNDNILHFILTSTYVVK